MPRNLFSSLPSPCLLLHPSFSLLLSPDVNLLPKLQPDLSSFGLEGLPDSSFLQRDDREALSCPFPDGNLSFQLGNVRKVLVLESHVLEAVDQ